MSLADGCVKTTVACLTLGDRGGEGSDHDPVLATVRKGEMRQAADQLRVDALELHNFRDGRLPWEDPETLAETISESIRRAEADVLVTFGPEGLYWHADHIVVHEQVTRAVKQLDGGIELYYATMPQGHVVEMVKAARGRGLELNAWGIDPAAFGAPRETITTVVDVRKYLPQKLAALRAHKTQFGSDNVFTNLPDDLAEKFLGYEYFVRAGGPHDTPDPLLQMLDA